jgi:rod shape-determining protein MreB and related proteins
MRLRAGVAIDLGTVNTLVYVAGRGIVLEEPSCVALEKETGRTVAVGHAADALTDKEPQGVEVLHPLRDGVVADLDAAVAMLRAFLRKARLRRFLLRPDAVVCVPSGATWVERRSLVVALESTKPRCRVRLVDEPVAAAAGAGYDLTEGAGAFVVDIGGGTTEAAVLAGGHVVRCQSLRLAGNAMDDAIMQAVRTEFSLLIGRNAARRLKMTLGLSEDATGFMEVVGVDAARRTPRVVYVPAPVIADALKQSITTIADSVEEMLSDIPPDLAEDIVRGKIRLAGGGALLPGLAAKIETVAGLPAVVVDDPLRCVVRGAAEILNRPSRA